MQLLYWLFNQVIGLYLLVVFIMVILSWLKAFGIVNQYNKFVAYVDYFCTSLTEPALRVIRQYVPYIGGLDLSVLVLFLAVRAFQFAMNTYFFLPALRAGMI
ncbi:MAG: YggT family protein [bacterium]